MTTTRQRLLAAVFAALASIASPLVAQVQTRPLRIEYVAVSDSPLATAVASEVRFLELSTNATAVLCSPCSWSFASEHATAPANADVDHIHIDERDVWYFVHSRAFHEHLTMAHESRDMERGALTTVVVHIVEVYRALTLNLQPPPPPTTSGATDAPAPADPAPLRLPSSTVPTVASPSNSSVAQSQPPPQLQRHFALQLRAGFAGVASFALAPSAHVHLSAYLRMPLSQTSTLALGVVSWLPSITLAEQIVSSGTLRYTFFRMGLESAWIEQIFAAEAHAFELQLGLRASAMSIEVEGQVRESLSQSYDGRRVRAWTLVPSLALGASYRTGDVLGVFVELEAGVHVNETRVAAAGAVAMELPRFFAAAVLGISVALTL